MIGCVLVPYFAAAVERRDEPSLGNVPLVITKLPEDSGKVFAVSEEVARIGVEPGMSLRQARAVCPQACIIPADRARYQGAFDAFLDILASFASGVEPHGPQPAAVGYLDLGHLERTEAVKMARRIGQTLREAVHLAPAVGLASGKFPAYVAAASIDPNKALIVTPGREATFLAPFPVDVLSLDEEAVRWLRLLGIRTLSQLAALPASAVLPGPARGTGRQDGLTQLGRQGHLLNQLAQGCDNRPVLPRRPERMESASCQFDGPVVDRSILEAAAQAMAVELADPLQARGLVGQELRLILYLENNKTREERLVMRQPINDSRRLTRILVEILTQVEVQCGVIGLEATVVNLTPSRGQQLDLFVHQRGQESRLQEALKDLAARYGTGCFYYVSLPDREAHLPERRFRLQGMEAP